MQHPKYVALNRSVALPAASNTNTSGPVDTQETALSAHAQTGDLVCIVDVPTLNTALLPNAATITYTLLESNNANLSSPISSTVMGVQTGAGGVGAAGGTFAARPKAVGGKYLGLQIASSGTVGSVTALSVTLQLLSQRLSA